MLTHYLEGVGKYYVGPILEQEQLYHACAQRKVFCIEILAKTYSLCEPNLLTHLFLAS